MALELPVMPAGVNGRHEALVRRSPVPPPQPRGSAMIRTRARMATALALLLLLILSAPAADQAARSASATDSDMAWLSAFGTDHPLAGRIWRPSDGRFVDRDTVAAALEEATFGLLGEKHDNPDHHRLQSLLIEALIGRGRRPAVVFEMFATDQAPAIAEYLGANPGDAAGLGAAVGWAERGWPDWEMYAPMVQAALDAGLPVAAADLPKDVARTLRRQGTAGLEAGLIARLGLDRPLDPAARAVMATVLRDSHCGQLPEHMIEPMVLAQRARDAHIALSLVEAATAADGGVLITGAGHARTDHGVPWHLKRLAPGRLVRTVALIEVSEAMTDPREYAEIFGVESLPFDFVWFTPRVDVGDPCEKFSEQLKQLEQGE